MSKDKKICIYTCITGEYDSVKELNFKEKNVDYYLFTNNKKISSDDWDVVYVENDGLDNIRLARKIKILGHPILKKYDIVVWIDGSIYLKCEITKFLKKYFYSNKYSFVGFKHQARDCIYDECKACIKHKKEDKEVILKQVQFLKKAGYPTHNGLLESTVIVRNFNDEKVVETCKIWFDMVVHYSFRDQLSFNYAAYVAKLNFKMIDLDVFNNDYFGSKVHTLSRKIDKYRIYFGNDSDLNNFKYELDVAGFYEKKNDSYIANVKVPKNEKKFKLELCKIGGVCLKSIFINGKNVSFDAVNGFYLDDKLVFFSYDPTIIVKYNLRKNESLLIEVQLLILNEIDYFQMINQLNHEKNILNMKFNNIVLQNEQLKNQNNLFVHSKSYRITKPLRYIGKKIRGFRGEN